MLEINGMSKVVPRQSWASHAKRLCRAAGGHAWRVGVFVVGMTILALGVVLLPLPGPGMLVVVVGLGVLSVEFAWARGGLAKLRAVGAKLRERVRERLAMQSERKGP